MTRQTIYRKLRKIAHHFTWKCDGGQIRGYLKDERSQRYCPITSLGQIIEGKFYPIDEFESIGDNLSITRSDLKRIIVAADNQDDADPACRKALLRAVGLLTEK